MSVNNLAVTLDVNSFYNALISKFINALEQAVRDTIVHMKQMSDMGKFESKADWIELLVHKGEDEIIYQVGVDHWYAFISNYGSGSLMDKGDKNPYFEQYVSSDLFNKKRLSHGYSVVGRGIGVEYPDITNPNGKKRVGKMADTVNLEELDNTKTGMKYFTPQAPKYWFENSLEHFRMRLEYHIIEAYKTVSLNDFIIGGGIR